MRRPLHKPQVPQEAPAELVEHPPPRSLAAAPRDHRQCAAAPRATTASWLRSVEGASQPSLSARLPQIDSNSCRRAARQRNETSTRAVTRHARGSAHPL